MGFNILKFVYVYILKKLNPGLHPNLQKKKKKKGGGGGVTFSNLFVIILKKLNPGLHPTWGGGGGEELNPGLHPT